MQESKQLSRSAKPQGYGTYSCASAAPAVVTGRSIQLLACGGGKGLLGTAFPLMYTELFSPPTSVHCTHPSPLVLQRAGKGPLSLMP